MPFLGEKLEKPEFKFSGEYIGGHKLYPKKRDLDILVYDDRIFITKLNLDIPFTSIKNIENSEAERLTKTRMFLTPFFIGFSWKKKYLYTVIDYNDGIDDQSIVFDFHRSVEKVQGTIYQKMIAARRNNLEQIKSIETTDVSKSLSYNNSLDLLHN